MSNNISRLGDNSQSLGTTIFQGKMEANHKMNNLAALRKVANNMMSEQNKRINEISKHLKFVGNPTATDESKVNHLFKLNAEVKREIQYLNEYSVEINNHNSKNLEKLSNTLFINKKKIEDKLISMRAEMKKSINDLVTSVVSPVKLVASHYADISMHMPGLISNLQNNHDLIEDYEWQEDLDKYTTHKNLIDNSLNVLNKWVAECEINNDAEGFELVKERRDYILSQQTKFNEIGLTKFVIEGLTAEFTSSNGYMNRANDVINDMNNMDSLLRRNLVEYNKNPTIYGGKTGKMLSTRGFIVAKPDVRMGIASESKSNYSNFIDLFKQKYLELEAVKGVDKIVLNNAIKLVDKFSSLMPKLESTINLYKNKVEELLKDKTHTHIEHVDIDQVSDIVQVSEKLASMISVKNLSASESAMTNNIQTDFMVLPAVPVEING